jgi:hypothetical protein
MELEEDGLRQPRCGHSVVGRCVSLGARTIQGVRFQVPIVSSSERYYRR